jgi:SAM-dependent methyltransferase
VTDVQPIKDIQKRMWSLGDYRELARQFEPTAAALVEACGVGPGMEVLEVAAGTGNLAVAAARRGARVVASDLTPRMVELGQQRSAAEGLAIEWLEADAEDLPFDAGRFDVAASTFGAMFAPRPQVAATELFRVVRSGGTVGLANWTPQGYLGRQIDLASGATGRRRLPESPRRLLGESLRSCASAWGSWRCRLSSSRGWRRCGSIPSRLPGSSRSATTARSSPCGTCCRRSATTR